MIKTENGNVSYCGDFPELLADVSVALLTILADMRIKYGDKLYESVTDNYRSILDECFERVERWGK